MTTNTTPAPACLTIHFTLSGYQTELTVYGNSGAELLKKARPAIAGLEKMGAEPTAPIAAGNGGNGDAQPETMICPLHHTQMKLRTGQGGSWYSHKAVNPDTGQEYWCKGKEK